MKNLAEELELTTAYIHAIETGKRIPSPRTIRDYSVVLKVPREIFETFDKTKAEQNGYEKTLFWLLGIICQIDSTAQD